MMGFKSQGTFLEGDEKELKISDFTGFFGDVFHNELFYPSLLCLSPQQ